MYNLEHMACEYVVSFEAVQSRFCVYQIWLLRSLETVSPYFNDMQDFKGGQ